MSEFEKRANALVPRKAIALFTAITLSLGVSACKESAPVEHDPTTQNKLTRILKPKLNTLGRLAVCLGKQHDQAEYISDFDSRDNGTVTYRMDWTDVYGERTSSFQIRMGTKSNTEQPDPTKTVSAIIGLGDAPVDHYEGGIYNVSRILAPGQPGNPTSTSYFAENDLLEHVGAPATLISTNSENTRAITATQELTDPDSMNWNKNVMRHAVNISGDC